MWPVFSLQFNFGFLGNYTARDYQGFRNPCRLWVGYGGVRVRVVFSQPSPNPYPRRGLAGLLRVSRRVFCRVWIGINTVLVIVDLTLHLHNSPPPGLSPSMRDVGHSTQRRQILGVYNWREMKKQEGRPTRYVWRQAVDSSPLFTYLPSLLHINIKIF